MRLIAKHRPLRKGVEFTQHFFYDLGIMAKARSKASQKKHDVAVLNSAKWYKTRGYNVSAAIEGFRDPKLISGSRPDLIARKGGTEILIEVETKDTKKRHESQHEAFKKYASRKGERKFRVKVV